MKNIKKTTVLTLLITVLLTTAVFAIITFKDTKPADWYMDTVSKLVKRGGIEGYPDNTFKPNKEMTKAEFVKTVVASLGFNEELDTEPHWSSNYIRKAVGLNIIDIKDFPSNKLDEIITRNDMAKVAVKVLEYNKEKFTEDFNKYAYQIKDFANIQNDYKDYVLKAYVKGIITGYPDGTFKGDRGLTRAEASTVIIRILEPNERILPPVPKEPTTNNTTTINTGLVKEEDKPINKITIEPFKDSSGTIKPGTRLEDLPDAPIEYVINDVDFKLKSNHSIATITEILTTNDIQRLQSYGYNWHTGYVNEVPPRAKFGELEQKEAEAVAKDFIPQRLSTFKNAIVGWVTDSNSVYKTPKGNYGVRGILQLSYLREDNMFDLEPYKLYERDVEFRYANTTDGLFLRQIVYLNDWKEVN